MKVRENHTCTYNNNNNDNNNNNGDNDYNNNSSIDVTKIIGQEAVGIKFVCKIWLKCEYLTDKLN